MTSIRFILLSLVLAGISSCYKEVELPPEPDVVFELSVTSGMREFIYESRDTSYTIDEPGMELLLDRQPLELKEIKTRGKSALRYQRKSYAVVLNEAITVPGADGIASKSLLRFKLISMSMDYTYIENRIAFGMLGDQDLMPLFYRFVELKINGDTQGVYLLLEDPEQYFIDRGSEYILRRTYNHRIDDAEYEPSGLGISEADYQARYQEIYSNLPDLHGEELFHRLNERLNLNQYFKKMGIDYLLQNGDYTDELYLYALMNQDQIRFNIIPWDYDDIFRDRPHEVGVTWGTGNVFGDRYYATHQDVLDELNGKMIFSIEDDLDYAIAMDPYLYTKYENTLANMIEQIHPEDVDDLFSSLRDELLPFYMKKEVVLQSRFDEKESSYERWEENMEHKKTFIKERLLAMKEQLKEPGT